MDRMQPPPNFYGAPYPNTNMDPNGPYKQPYVSQQPPQPQSNAANNNSYPPSTPPSMEDDDHNMKWSTNFYKGKHMKVFCSFPDSSQWHDVIFDGYLEYSENDHLVIRDIKTNHYMIIVAVYVNYIELLDA